MKRVAIVLALLVLGAAARDRIIIRNPCLQSLAWYKGDCETVGSLVHCKDAWFEIHCYDLSKLPIRGR